MYIGNWINFFQDYVSVSVFVCVLDWVLTTPVVGQEKNVPTLLERRAIIQKLIKIMRCGVDGCTPLYFERRNYINIIQPPKMAPLGAQKFTFVHFLASFVRERTKHQKKTKIGNSLINPPLFLRFRPGEKGGGKDMCGSQLSRPEPPKKEYPSNFRRKKNKVLQTN